MNNMMTSDETFATSVPAVSLLKDLKHANIVTLHDIVHTDKSLTLVFEYLVRLSHSPSTHTDEHLASSFSFCLVGSENTGLENSKQCLKAHHSNL